MKNIILLLFASIAGLSGAQAKLGDSLDQCVAMYGAAVSNNNKSDENDVKGVGPEVAFDKDGVKVWIVFYNNKVGYERFGKSDITEDLPYSDALAILAKESPLQDWVPAMSDMGEGLMRQKDQAFAQYYFPNQKDDALLPHPHQLTVVAFDYSRAIDPNAKVKPLPLR